jgi:predicted RNase H-like HicB family nuclease
VLRVILEKDRFENGFPAYHAFCPALNGCHTWGHSREEALANIREAAKLYVEDLIDASR